MNLMVKMLKLLILSTLLILRGLGDDDFLSRFYQSDYKIRDYLLDIKSFNKDIYYFFKITTFKFNRTTPVSNITFSQKMSLDGKQYELLVQAYKFTSNEYRTFPMRFQMNLWKGMMTNVCGIGLLSKCGNVSLETFFFEKNKVYHICNFSPDESRLPPRVPIGRYKLVNSMFIGQQPLAEIDIFYEIYRPVTVRD